MQLQTSGLEYLNQQTMKNIEITVGQSVDWYGATGCIMDIDNESVTIEVLGESILTDVDELAEQNPDLVIDD